MADEEKGKDEKAKKKKEIHVTSLVRHKGPVSLPEDLSVEDAIEFLKRRMVYDAEDVSMSENIPVFWADGALALAKALEEQFGFAMQEADWHPFFGKIPPQQIQVEISPGRTVSVPWGKFGLPGILGTVQTGIHRDQEGRMIFKVLATVKHRDEEEIKRLFGLTRRYALAESIYRAKAIQIRFRDDNDQALPMPHPKFLRLSNIPVIFNRDLEDAIETYILTPIRFSKASREINVPLKRGAVLGGPYGTGKTLTASWIARVATEHGYTFIYVQKVEELAEALRFAQFFQPAVVFAEDIDRAAGATRTDQVNELLNTLDGIGSKSDEIFTILTSNFAENINEAMRRPGRIDIVLSIDPPYADTAVRLVRHYAGKAVLPGEDLAPAGKYLEGQIPAVISEVVQRAKLEAIRRSEGKNHMIVAADLIAAATVQRKEQTLFKPKTGPRTQIEQLGDAIGRNIGREIGKAIINLPTAGTTNGEEADPAKIRGEG